MNTFHKQIEITYDETDNLWRFELRGRHRSATSLTKAREVIDKPVDVKEEKPFKRCSVYVKDHYREFELAVVTSVADNPKYRSAEVWVVQNRQRSKAYARCCFPVNDKNTALVHEWKRLDKEMEAIRNKRDAIEERMQPLDL